MADLTIEPQNKYFYENPNPDNCEEDEATFLKRSSPYSLIIHSDVDRRSLLYQEGKLTKKKIMAEDDFQEGDCDGGR